MAHGSMAIDPRQLELQHESAEKLSALDTVVLTSKCVCLNDKL